MHGQTVCPRAGDDPQVPVAAAEGTHPPSAVEPLVVPAAVTDAQGLFALQCGAVRSGELSAFERHVDATPAGGGGAQTPGPTTSGGVLRHVFRRNRPDWSGSRSDRSAAAAPDGTARLKVGAAAQRGQCAGSHSEGLE